LGDSKKAESEQLKKETRERLEAFRKQQDATARPASPDLKDSNAGAIDGEDWAAVGRKRKRGKDDNKLGVKLRKISSSEKSVAVEKLKGSQNPTTAPKPIPPLDGDEATGSVFKEPATATKPVGNISPPKAPSALVGYDSDEDDE
jgi:hypothetical protein